MLTEQDRQRYMRQIVMKGIGEEGQQKLKDSKVLVIGAGGLGSPVLFYLAAAGIGEIGIVDNDTVSLSNLNRQILHTDDDIDVPKVESAVNKLQKLNYDTKYNVMQLYLDEGNMEEILSQYDLVVDCVDNNETRYLINHYAVKLGIPLVEGGVRGLEGYILPILPGKTPCYRCVYPEKTNNAPGPIPILGGTAGAVGSMQAVVAVRMLLGQSVPAGKLTFFQFAGLTSYQMEVFRDPDCPDCGKLY
ncbi:MAG: HesA/MoeB/ThiF family protein [Clostridiales bacterium]|nr:HesA/MoeB/ThiF family protein [Clostridiales bacterium]